MDRRGFVGSAVAAGLATSLTRGVSPPLVHAAEATAPPPPETPVFNRSRAKLSDEPDPQELFDDIRAVIVANPGKIGEHKLNNGAHGVGSDPRINKAFGVPVDDYSGKRFFTWHREYLQWMEHGDRLGRRLPSWAPWEPVPEPFRTPRNLAKIDRVPDGDRMRQAFAAYQKSALRYYDNVNILGVCLSWTAHFAVHFECGNDMGNIGKAANAPLFWCWHAFVDEIFEDYNRQKAKFPEKPSPPKLRFPGDIQGASNTGGRSGSGGNSTPTVLVPWAIGLHGDTGTQLIEAAGLRVERQNFDRFRKLVINQGPLPGNSVPRGSTVVISGDGNL